MAGNNWGQSRFSRPRFSNLADVACRTGRLDAVKGFYDRGPYHVSNLHSLTTLIPSKRGCLWLYVA